jgi:hypothetical protein
MAVPQGEYMIQPSSSERITTYCLNKELDAPNANVTYNNVISGNKSAHVKIIKPGKIETFTLKEAIANGVIEIQGNTLSELPCIDEFRKQARNELEKAYIEYIIKKASSNIQALSDHQSLIFKNQTLYPIKLSFETNIQLGNGNEAPEEWIEGYKLSKDLSTQHTLQGKLWEYQRIKAKTEENKLREIEDKKTAEAEKKLYLEREKELNQEYFGRIKTLGYDRKIKEFQQLNGLLNSNKFDIETIEKVAELESIHQNEFNQIGIKESNLSAQISEYQRCKNLDQTGVLDAVIKSLLQKDLKNGIYFYKRKAYKTISVGKNAEKYIESKYSQNMLIPLEKIDEYSALMENMSRRGFIREEVEVLSFVMDRNTVLKLKTSFPGQYTEFYNSEISSLKKKLKSKSRKSLFILGHIENNAFVGKNAKSEVIFSISIKDIEAIAKELNINIFLLGCNSAFSSETRTGVGNEFNTIYALDRLDHALNSSTDVCGLLGKLASQDLKILLENNPLQDLEYLTVKMAKASRTKGGISTAAAILGGVGVIALLYASKDDKKDQKIKKQ